MGYALEQVIELFKKHDEIEIISAPLDIYLEIAHLSYIEAKKEGGGKALLFTNPIDSRRNKKFSTPVLTNIFGSFKRVELIATRQAESIANQIKELLNLAPPKGLKGIISAIKRYSALYYTLPKVVAKSSAQEVCFMGEDINLYDLPILTTWEGDAAPFITMGQVYTQSLDGKKKNLGLYRLQVHSKNRLGLHWQVHKDSAHFFHEYKRAGQKMPVSIALGGDPLYVWCGQAPLPNGVYELMLYGLIKRKRVRVVKCLTNPLSVPSDVDIIIEGYVDTQSLLDEGPFGDHTGFYTPIEGYPVLEVSAITHVKSPIFPATVVGKPPLEDKYMGFLTERVFLPLLQTSASGLIDYKMPENGVFHNLILAKIAPQYNGHAKQIMHAFWGVGQMSFVKHAIFVGEDAPRLDDYPALLEYVLNRFDVSRIVISEGICDALDHASPQYAYGGKLGLDVSAPLGELDSSLDFVANLDSSALDSKTAKEQDTIKKQNLSDENLCKRLQGILDSSALRICVLRRYGKNARKIITIIGVEKLESSVDILSHIKPFISELEGLIDIGIFVDASKNDLDNAYMLIWRIVNNIDARRDVLLSQKGVFIDASDKICQSSHPREWPKETDCTKSVIDGLIKKGFEIDSRALRRFHICESISTKDT